MSKKIIAIIVLMLLFIQNNIIAQPAGINEPAMRSHNKIYVVMAVCITILVGFILYLVRIDSKVKKLENNQH